jgi:hypothetical protein
MNKNVIILTSGLSGSSVLTALIARAGFWTGDSTFKKQDYDTFENQELIDLNLRLFREAEYRGNYLLEFSPAAMERIAALYRNIDSADYRSFIGRCEQRRPWIWKDPRLWLTIRFWKNLLDLDQCSFILLTRGTVQSWISSTLRRQITTYRYSRNYEDRIRQSIVDFLEENRQPYLHLEYEELIEKPERAIPRLNDHLGTELTVRDLAAVYHKPLYKSPRNSWAKHIKALLIYLKNYSERLDIVAERE